MPALPAPPAATDWTAGPAKWVAVAILSLLSAIGMAWAMLRPIASATSAPPAPPSAPAPLAALPAPAPVPPAPVPAPSLHRKINLNTASSAELQLLPGVGPAVAQRIIDHRASRGPFRTVLDLDQVKGIGPRTVEKLRDLVTITD